VSNDDPVSAMLSQERTAAPLARVTGMSSKILIVDDDPAVLNSLRRALSLEGFDVLLAADGETALALAASAAPALVVLDVMLPGIDGFTVCQQIRARSDLPVLMLTARDTVPDRVAGLDRGADDYLVKPFAFDELLARIRALLRRSQPHDDDTLAFSDVQIDRRAREARRDGQPLPLTPREYDLLTAFLEHPRQALSREQLSQLVWGYGFEGESNFVDVAVMDLRRKLEAGSRPRLLQTVRGYGYALREA
jgi:two-component system, OmpR family, response regulator MprA